jgi:hypothetical protein
MNNLYKNILPYNKSNPIICDNDSHSDTYTDELLMVLCSAGEIDLRGMITTSPENCCVNIETYSFDAAGREEIYKKAVRSGLKNLPAPVKGPSKPLLKPSSGKIEDTLPIDTAGSRLIVEEARKASKDKPLVLIMGAPLTAAADAYLLDNSIAGKVVVSWLGGTLDDINDYNGVMDIWAAYIVIQKLRMIQFPAGLGAPSVPKEKLNELPDTELVRYMKDKRLPHVNALPLNIIDDADSQPVISLLREDYITGYKSMCFDCWYQSSQGIIPRYREAENGNITVITGLNGKTATEAWWQAFKDPKAWNGGKPFAAEQRSFYAAAFPIGSISRIEAEDFDLGGEGISYHCKNNKVFGKTYRADNVEIINAKDETGGYNMGQLGGYCITGLTAGDWLKYTVNIEKEGLYEISVRTASKGRGGSLHLEFNEVIKTNIVEIPDTKGDLSWQSINTKILYLKQGKQVMKLIADTNGDNGALGNINYFKFSLIK